MHCPSVASGRLEPLISVREADALAAGLLGDLRTGLGGLHIAHARRVADSVRHLGDERLVIAALLHDVVEKERIDMADLAARVGDDEVMDLVDVLTHDPGATEREYLSRCAAHPQALPIKRSDLMDKLTANDADVPARVARQLQRQAAERLTLLDQLGFERLSETAMPLGSG
jgi:(p)ppGpp synthase/HD superfamily hydrolase